MELREEKEFHVAISFSVHDNEIAEKIARSLINKGLSVFYYPDHQVEMVGRNLIDELSSIYSDRCNYCLILFSKNYIEGNCTKIERQIAQKADSKMDDRFIIPAKLDECDITGILGTTVHIDIDKSIESHVESCSEIINSIVSRTVAIEKAFDIKPPSEIVSFVLSSDFTYQLAKLILPEVFPEWDMYTQPVPKEAVRYLTGKFLIGKPRMLHEYLESGSYNFFSPIFSNSTKVILDLNSDIIHKVVNTRSYGGAGDMRVVGCKGTPHSIQFESSLENYNKLREYVLKGELESIHREIKLNWSIKRLYKDYMDLPPPAQAAVYYPNKKIEGGSNCVCHLEYIQGHEKHASQAIQSIGSSKTKSLNNIKIFILKTGNDFYVHSNYVKEGCDYPTKIAHAINIDLFTLLLNIVATHTPDEMFYSKLERLHSDSVEYVVDIDSMKEIDTAFYGAAQNIRTVSLIQADLMEKESGDTQLSVMIDGKWSLADKYDGGTITGEASFHQIENKIYGDILITETDEYGEQITILEEVEGIIRDKDVHLVGTSFRVMAGDADDYLLDRWSGVLVTENQIIGTSCDTANTVGEFKLQKIILS